MTNIDIYSATIKELKAFCTDNNIEIPQGIDKRKRDGYMTIIEAWKFNQSQEKEILDNPTVEDVYDADIDAIINDEYDDEEGWGTIDPIVEGKRLAKNIDELDNLLAWQLELNVTIEDVSSVNFFPYLCKTLKNAFVAYHRKPSKYLRCRNNKTLNDIIRLYK